MVPNQGVLTVRIGDTKMKSKYKLSICALVLVILLGPGFASIPITEPQVQANPQFILSSWDFPDEYGQGIDTLTVYENSTGAWLAVGGFSPNVGHTDEGSFNWNASLGIKVRVDCWLNSILTGVSSTAEGKNHIRHNVTVTQTNGSVVFSQNNFTYFAAGALGNMYEYYYDVVLNFLPQQGEIYAVTITYEVYY